jgi:hypothetical protein
VEGVASDGFGVWPSVADLADLHDMRTKAEMSEMKGKSANESEQRSLICSRKTTYLVRFSVGRTLLAR